nr:glycoside hydrolase family 70 protein [Leuconostoc mesenteroides]
MGDSSVPDVSANNVQSASDNTTDTQQNTTITEENDKVQSAATNDNVTTAASDTTQSAVNNVTEKQPDAHSLDSATVNNKQDEVAQTNVTSKNEESAVASTDTDPAETTTDETQQVSGNYVEKDGSWYYYFDDGKNAKGLSTIDNNIQYFNDEGQQIFNQYYQSENGTTYYFDDKGHAATGIKNIEGKNYYFDNLGQLKKGFSGVIDGQIMTFDQETGQEVSNTTSEIKEGLTTQNTDYSEHNAAHGTDAEDFENIDGYLTASSWYRPTDILRNGTDWEPSTDTDFRPILSVWWPDKNTQVNYLNYMADLGFISNADSFETGDSQSLLNEASNYVQKSIEMKISAQQSTEWLKDAMAAFIVTQPQWNETSEDMSNDHLQNGALTYVNSPLTPDANSNFRLLNRTPTNQTGEQAYNLDNSKGGFELLLANDVDNSNPVVQAEQLNWLYYLMNFGTITGNDVDANFDGIRVDAVDNVDADLLQIAADYFKLAYGVDQNYATANQHLSILEDWSHNDPLYVTDQGSDQLTMDDYVHTQLIWSLTKSSDIRGTMQRFVDYYMVDRSNDSTENEAIPNYSFVRAHDSEVQTVIAQIVSDLYPDVENSLAPTTEQLAAAFKVYNEDEKLADKKYTQYNMASAYAMLLTNKDTVPRVYYGDLYTDDGQYMATKSPYYDAINTLLKARVQYVAGG